MTPYFETQMGKLYRGNAVNIISQLPDNSVDCIITSPPYYGLRNYKTEGVVWGGDKNCQHEWGYTTKKVVGNSPSEKTTLTGGMGIRKSQEGTIQSNLCKKCGAWKGELGAEPTFDMYITHLCGIFVSLRSKLKDTGTLWVNIGDTYASGGGKGKEDSLRDNNYKREPDNTGKAKYRKTMGKSLLCIPDRLKIALVDSGWICRNDIIWYKKSCMPSATTDRFTVDYERLLFFTQSNKPLLWRNDITGEWIDTVPPGIAGKEGVDWDWCETDYSTSNTKIDKENAEDYNSPRARKYRKDKRYKKSHWITHTYYFTQQYEPNSPVGIARMKRAFTNNGEMVKKGYKGDGEHFNYNCVVTPEMLDKGRHKQCVWEINTASFPEAHFAVFPEALIKTPIEAGCPPGGTVLDMFFGSGTVGAYCEKHDRHWIGIELSEDYCAMAKRRILPIAGRQESHLI